MTIEVVDARGVVVPGAGPLIEVRVGGAGSLGGVDSGHQARSAGHHYRDQAGHDQPEPGHRNRFPDDRRAVGHRIAVSPVTVP
jgi:hypothetical protein